MKHNYNMSYFHFFIGEGVTINIFSSFSGDQKVIDTFTRGLTFMIDGAQGVQI